MAKDPTNVEAQEKSQLIRQLEERVNLAKYYFQHQEYQEVINLLESAIEVR